MLLSGGMDGWAKVAGESGIIGKGPACSPLHAPQTSFTHSSMNGTPIILRQPIIGSDKIHPTTGNGMLDGASDIKCAWQQVALLQQDSPSPQTDLQDSPQGTLSFVRCGFSEIDIMGLAIQMGPKNAVSIAPTHLEQKDF
ncbi:hypothetical protein CROQUDRAFT_134530 [Cronartium quercuum f. sp. fusiforme G11]|uniref:Uncharacterized protein n=1 Tax=Cronartium quercuum f. sp. fusiforme G11 TaxID=708437 RepID=A0A9P6NHA0_9BASI|nr:hypothetical protein CROQUDRAFT_134530 [Cronartium quercuum f. sp. fusiforme G11]